MGVYDIGELFELIDFGSLKNRAEYMGNGLFLKYTLVRCFFFLSLCYMYI